MPWRHDFVHSFWVDPDWAGFSGYPGDESTSKTPPKPAGPSHVRSLYPIHAASPDQTERPLGAAVIVIRDRTGFRY